MYYLWNIEVNIETHTLDGACLGLIFSIFTAAVDYCTYSGSASLSHPMMDRCKSSQSCSDSPISPNLICLKNAALTLYSLVSPLLSSSTFRFPFYYTFFPLFRLRSRTILLHTHILSPYFCSTVLFSHPLLASISLPPLPVSLARSCVTFESPVIFSRVKILFHHLLNIMCF